MYQRIYKRNNPMWTYQEESEPEINEDEYHSEFDEENAINLSNLCYFQSYFTQKSNYGKYEA